MMSDESDVPQAFQVDPDAELRTYLPHGGKYGPGLTHDCKVQLTDFTPSCRASGEQGPGFDKECQRCDYSAFTFRVFHPEYGECPVFDYQPHGSRTGSKLFTWLRAMGYTVAEKPGPDGRPTNEFYPGEILASLPKDCAIEIAAPRKDKTDPRVEFTGKLLNVFGV